MPWKRVLIVFCLIVVAETINGILRRLYLEPVVGSLQAAHIGLVVALALIFVICLATSRWLGLRSKLGWMQVGLVLVVLMLAFEVGLGRARLGGLHRNLSRTRKLVIGQGLGFQIAHAVLSIDVTGIIACCTAKLNGLLASRP